MDEIQKEEFSPCYLDLAYLPHAIPDDPELTTMNQKDKMSDGIIIFDIHLLGDSKLWHELVCFTRGIAHCPVPMCAVCQYMET